MRCLILVAALILSGCVYQTIDAPTIKAANNLCKTHDGVAGITAIFAGIEIIHCKNGTSFDSSIYKPKKCIEEM